MLNLSGRICCTTACSTLAVPRHMKSSPPRGILAFVLGAFCCLFLTKIHEQLNPEAAFENTNRCFGKCNFQGSPFFNSWVADQHKNVVFLAGARSVESIDTLQAFQDVTHSRLMRAKLRHPLTILLLDTLLSDNGRPQEYWKTSLPTIFDPSGYYFALFCSSR